MNVAGDRGGALALRGLAGRGTGPGEIILAVALPGIALTAPLGAWAIALAGERWLMVAPTSLHDARDPAVESDAARE